MAITKTKLILLRKKGFGPTGNPRPSSPPRIASSLSRKRITVSPQYVKTLACFDALA